MAESSLAVTWSYIRQRVAQYRGYRMDTTVWVADETELLDICLRDGSAMFYLQANHEWSFMQPLVTLTLLDGEQDLELPWDFGFVVDQTIYFDDNVGREMKVVNDGLVLLRRQNEANTTGRPIYGAVVTETKPGGILGQRSSLMYWPVADQDYDVKIRYSVLGDALCEKTPIPYGGAAHSQTLLEACLAASERLDGNPQGPHNLLYAAALEISKAYDRRVKPRTLGYNMYAWRNARNWQPYAVEPVVYTPGP